jgi:hypothetical protein
MVAYYFAWGAIDRILLIEMKIRCGLAVVKFTHYIKKQEVLPATGCVTPARWPGVS